MNQQERHLYQKDVSFNVELLQIEVTNGHKPTQQMIKV